MESRIVDGLKVVEVEPDAPLPDGVPSWAERCDLVKEPNTALGRRPWMIAMGALGTLGAGAMLAFSSVSTDEVARVLIASLVALWFGLRPGTTAVLTPAPRGRYVVVDDGDPGPMTPEERSAMGLAMAFGGFVMLIGVVMLLSGDWEGIVFTAFGWGFYRSGRTGRMNEPEFPPASARFRELADPARPLAADDPVTATPPGAALPEPHPADEPSRPTLS